MEIIRISFLGFFAVLLLSASVAQAQPPGSPPGQGNSLRARVVALETALAEAQNTISNLQGRLAAVEGNSVLALDGVLFLETRSYPTALFRGVNVQVVNGTGATDTINGVGNLIVGYNNPRIYSVPEVCSDGQYDNQTDCESAGETWAVNHKTGSHNIVGGDQNSYSSYGGVVFGWENAINRRWANISGGAYNIASGPYANINGGFSNTASGNYASVSGGIYNTASGGSASVSGGNKNTASGNSASVSGGYENSASNNEASVSGGHNNTASGFAASVSGGVSNTASGSQASVSGGFDNSASGSQASISGGGINTASGPAASISGGRDNSASHDYSSILGGQYQTSSSDFDTIPGLP